MKKVAQSKRDLNLCEGNFRRDISRISEFSESIAFYGGESLDMTYAQLRHQFYCEAMEKQGLKAALLESCTKKDLNKYSAIVCVNDLRAAELYKIIYQYADPKLSRIRKYCTRNCT